MRRFFIPASERRPPFVLVLHPFGGSGEQMERELGLVSFARQHGVAYAAPDASFDDHGHRAWNADDVCCNLAHRELDDVGRLIAIIEDAVKTFGVDQRRVFVVGYSNGGFMAHRLACAYAQGVRGIVSMAAAGPDSAQQCQPENPVAVLEVHGDRDTVVPYPGGHLFGRADWPSTPSVEKSLSPWASANGCEGKLRFKRRFDFISDISGDETAVGTYDRCRGAPLILWRVAGGRHALRLDGRALDAVWQFLVDSQPRP